MEKTRGRGRWLGVDMKGNSSRAAAAEPEGQRSRAAGDQNEGLL